MCKALVSIGMPVYNCEKTLAMAVASILNQDYQNWELILIDDGSRDGSLEIAHGFCDPRIRVIAGGANRQLAARLNQAVELSNGRYFARMDGDDVAYPERLRLQVRYMQQHPEVDLLGGGMVVFRSSGEAYGVRFPATTHRSICAHPWSSIPMAHPTWMGKVEWFRNNPYRIDALRMEDKDLLFRTYRSSQFANLPKILLGYREDTVSLTKILPSRLGFSRLLIEYGRSSANYSFVVRGLCGQGVRTLGDVVAVATGLNHRLLRHRARPLNEMLKEQWRTVWSDTQARISGRL